MKEIISLYIGQAGVQLSSAAWELFAAEHDITIGGIINSDNSENMQGLEKLFYTNANNQVIPRCVLIDMEPTVIDEIRTGSYKQFFGDLNLLSGSEDSSSLFSRGYFTQGRYYINEFLHKFQQQLEIADSVQGLVFLHALGGGTGSGFYSLILEELNNYTKITKLDLAVHPSFSSSQIVVEPYNSLLTEHYTIDESDISFMVDNEALFKIATDQLMINNSSYALINKIVAQLLSLITSSARYSNNSCTISEILHNLVPFPRIHYPTCSLSPLHNAEQHLHAINTIICITRDGLSKKFQLLSCDPLEGKFMTCCLMYRGNITSGEVHDAIKKLKCYEKLKFVDWCPTGIKVTLCSKSPSYISRSKIGPSDKLLAVISNNSSITDPLLHNTFRFQILFQKRAFVHWYVGEGMEEDEFKDSLENIACLIKDYEECTLSNKTLTEISPNVDESYDKDGSNINSNSGSMKKNVLNQETIKFEERDFGNVSEVDKYHGNIEIEGISSILAGSRKS